MSMYLVVRAFFKSRESSGRDICATDICCNKGLMPGAWLETLELVACDGLD